MKTCTTQSVNLLMVIFALIPLTTFTQTSHVGIGTTTPLAPLHVDSTVLFTGTMITDFPAPPPVEGEGARMLWYADKAAFRAGSVNGPGAANWDMDSIGFNSFAAGRSAKAKGDRSVALGWANHALGYASTAFGFQSRARGDYSIAMGSQATSTGNEAISVGSRAHADAFRSIALGGYNIGGGDPFSWGDGTDPILEIGIGENLNDSINAMTVLKNGNIGLGIHQPKEVLEVAGAVKVGNNVDHAPAAGTIRWNPDTQDFEGYTGNEWKSLTRTGNSWGNSMTVCTENWGVRPSDPSAGKDFGRAVAISDQYAIIGAPGDPSGAINYGAAYIFKKQTTGWYEEAKLTADVPDELDFFGKSVAIDGLTAIVGSYRDDDGAPDAGAAYVFVMDSGMWVQQDKLIALDADTGDEFGSSVAVSGDIAVVGAPYEGSTVGAVYVFQRSGSTWTQLHKLTADMDAASGDYFGQSVAIDSHLIIVGAFGNDDDGNQSGSAYIFELSEGYYFPPVKLTASDADTNDLFGISVSISDTLAVVGASRDAYTDDDGAAYAFRKNAGSWVEIATLTASDVEPSSNLFGRSVGISGSNIVVGAYYGDQTNGNNGVAYIYSYTGYTWTEQAKLENAEVLNGFFGWAVSIFGDHVLVGASTQWDDTLQGAGAAYFYTK